MQQSIPGLASPCPERRFTRLPDALLSLLTPRQHMLVHALLSYRWWSDSAIYPSVPTLARQLGWSERTVQRIMRQLEAGGWIVVQACYRSDDGQASNLYEPGPALVPYLPPAPARPDTTPVTARRPAPVSAWSAERDAPPNRRPESTPRQLRGATAARSGERCPICAARRGRPHEQQACYRR